MRCVWIVLLAGCPTPVVDDKAGEDPVDSDPPAIDSDTPVIVDSAPEAGHTGDTAAPGELLCDGRDDDGDGLIDEDFDRDMDGVARCCVETEYVLWMPHVARPYTSVEGRPFAVGGADFGPVSAFTPISGADISVLAYGHFNEPIGSPDPARDLLWTDASTPNVYYLTQCLYGEWQKTIIDLPWQGRPASWGDFNNDGCMDFVQYDYACCHFGQAGGDGAGTTYLGACDGTFSPRARTSWDVTWLTGAWVGGMAYNSSDVNSDGNQDLVLFSLAHGGDTVTRVVWLPGDGAGDFGTAVTMGESAVASNSPAMGDVDGDGLVDVVLGPNDDGGPSLPNAAGSIWTLLGNGAAGTLGNLKLIEPAWVSFGAEDGDGAVRLWDYDKDGDLDIIATHEDNNVYGIGYFENDGQGNFPQSPTTELLPYFTWVTGVIVPIHQE